MQNPAMSSRDVARLLESLEKHPEALGYLNKFENANPAAGAYKNPLWYRGLLEETILHHAGRGDGDCLEMLLYADIRLTVFERYQELMAESRVHACVEDAYSGRRKSSRTGTVFNRCLIQLVDNGDTELFDAKLSTLMSMGGRKLMAVPVNAATVRPEDFFHARDVGASPEKLARFRFGVARLLDSGMVNILQHLSRPLDLALLTGSDKFREDVGKEKEQRYNYWQDYLKALVLGYKPGAHAPFGKLGIGASGAVFMTLRELVSVNDLEGVRKLSGSFDFAEVYATLDAALPLRKDLSKTFHWERDNLSFSPVSLLNLALPKTKDGSHISETSAHQDFEMLDLLIETGLAPYLAQPLHKAYFAAGIASDLEKAPVLFDAVYERTGLSTLVDQLSDADLVGKTAGLGYVCASFYLKRVRESLDAEKTVTAMLSKLGKGAQERIFEAPGFMARLGLTDDHRKYCSSDIVRSQMMAIDLGL